MKDEKPYTPQVNDSDNVRNAVKRFVKVFNDFLDFYHRVPSPVIKKEAKLYREWKRFTSFEGLNAEEIEYIKNNLRTIEQAYLEKEVDEEDIKNNIRLVVKKVVQEFNDFVEEHKRAPSYKNEDERSLYNSIIRYSKPNNITSAEKDYIDKYLNKKYLVRTALIKYVKDFNEYFVEHLSLPPANSNLYQRGRDYKPENLNPAELQYYINNIAFLPTISTDGVKPAVKLFVADYNNFVKDYKRAPNSAYANKSERKLYAKKLYYENPDNCSKKDWEYVNKNLLDAPVIRYYVIQFVEEYNLFVKTYNRHPYQFGGGHNEDSLYQRWVRYYLNHKNITVDEIAYIDNNIVKKSRIRTLVVEFVNDYLAFKNEHGREPSSSLKVPTPERNLAIRIHNYKYKLKLSEDEMEYLKEIGIDVRACRQSLKNKENKEITTV